GLAVVEPNATHDAVALRLNPDLAVIVLLGSHRVAVVVVGATEPLAVPSAVQDSLLHRVNSCLGASGFGLVAAVACKGRVVGADRREHGGNEHRLGVTAGLVLGGLEGLTWSGGEAVEVEAVIPVGSPNERQAMGAYVVVRVVKGPLEVVHEAGGLGFVVVE